MHHEDGEESSDERVGISRHTNVNRGDRLRDESRNEEDHAPLNGNSNEGSFDSLTSVSLVHAHLLVRLNVESPEEEAVDAGREF